MHPHRRPVFKNPFKAALVCGCGVALSLLINLFVTIHIHHTLEADIDTTASSSASTHPHPPLSHNKVRNNERAVRDLHLLAASISGTSSAKDNKGKSNLRTATANKQLHEHEHQHEHEHDEGIAACLLVNDENPRLPEWIAYHYTMLPLRHLIIAVDPASRSSPNEIMMQWINELGGSLNVRPWSEKRYLPAKMRGPCPTNGDAERCLLHHRNRQQYFIMKCMAEFKALNQTWVLLTDVDEYIVLNQIRGDDPALPMDEPPPPPLAGNNNGGSSSSSTIPVMADWRYHDRPMGFKDNERDNTKTVVVDGYVNGEYTRSDIIFSKKNETITYGSIVKDIRHRQYFLRDDIAYYEATALTEAPPGVPTLKEPWFVKTSFYANIYNDTYETKYTDRQFVPIEMNWTAGDETMRRFYGGHTITDVKGHMYYVESEHDFWPPHYPSLVTLSARARLPSIGDDTGATILDVLTKEGRQGYTRGKGLGPCYTMPRVLYGSREDHDKKTMSPPDGFDIEKFVTLRYQWHASKGRFESSKFGKTIIDVSRIPMKELNAKALNIHRPLVYHCRKDPPPYSSALFRVNHYLDSFEAYSYRNDVRSKMRQCKECYEKKGSDAAFAWDGDIQPWLHRFVKEVGYDKAQRLLSKAGDFVKLPTPHVTQ